MQHTEGIRQSRDDRQQLERNIKELEREIEAHKGEPVIRMTQTIREYRRLRRLRDKPKEEEQ